MITLLTGMAAICGGLTIFATPILIAAARGTERIGLVAVLTVAALGTGGITWPMALFLACRLPKARRAAPAAPWAAAAPAWSAASWR